MTMTESVSETKKVATHELVDATGAVVEYEEEARGYRYTLLANGKQANWDFDKATDDERRLMSIFGAKTLATNETSQVRNNPKGAGTPDEQIEAVVERFALIKTGQWVDRSREGVGAKVDLDKLATAVCTAKVEGGKLTQEQVDGGEYAATLQKLTEDVAYRAKVRKVPQVSIAYAALVGKAQVTVDDI